MEKFYTEQNIELQISQGKTLRVFNGKLEIYKKDSCIISDEMDTFIMTWHKFKRELGCDYLDILFYHPSVKCDFQISTNSWKKNFDVYKFFAQNIADKYFIKNIQKSFWKASGYGSNAFLKESKKVDNENQDKIFYSKLQNLPGFDSWGTKKEIKYLRNLLYENEEVFSISSGVMNGNTWLLACTSRRVLLIDCGMIYGVKHIEIMIDKINSISFKNGLLLGEIYIQDGASVKVITNVQKYSTKPFVDSVHRAMDLHKENNKIVVNHLQNSSSADEILKFKNLLDMGIISEEEFEKQKKKFLNM